MLESNKIHEKKHVVPAPALSNSCLGKSDEIKSDKIKLYTTQSNTTIY